MKVTCMVCDTSGEMLASEVPPDARLKEGVAIAICEKCMILVGKTIMERFFTDEGVTYTGRVLDRECVPPKCKCVACQLREAIEQVPDCHELIVQDWAEG